MSTDLFTMLDNFIHKWDPADLEVRTVSVERILQPLAAEVETLVNAKRPIKHKKGRSKTSIALKNIAAATENFAKIGKKLAFENKDITHDMLCAVEELRVAGIAMSNCSCEFTEDPNTPPKLENIAAAAKDLLSAVTRILIIADMVNVHALLKFLNAVEDDFENLLDATELEELVCKMFSYRNNVINLMHLSAKRQRELKNPYHKKQIAVARAILTKHAAMLVTTSKVCLHHKNLIGSHTNRHYAFTQMYAAVRTITDVIRGVKQHTQVNQTPGDIATSFEIFNKLLEIDPMDYDNVHTRNSLEDRLENIISRAAIVADSITTNKEMIIAECIAARISLQALLNEYIKHKDARSNNLTSAIDNIKDIVDNIRKLLRQTVVVRVAEYMQPNGPLVQLMASAQDGDRERTEICVSGFTQYVDRLIDVANLSRSISNNDDGVKMVHLSAFQLQQLYPEVIAAARILVVRPASFLAQDNMDVFQYTFDFQVRSLTDAITKISVADEQEN